MLHLGPNLLDLPSEEARHGFKNPSGYDFLQKTSIPSKNIPILFLNLNMFFTKTKLDFLRQQLCSTLSIHRISSRCWMPKPVTSRTQPVTHLPKFNSFAPWKNGGWKFTSLSLSYLCGFGSFSGCELFKLPGR